MSRLVNIFFCERWDFINLFRWRRIMFSSSSSSSSLFLIISCHSGNNFLLQWIVIFDGLLLSPGMERLPTCIRSSIVSGKAEKSSPLRQHVGQDLGEFLLIRGKITCRCSYFHFIFVAIKRATDRSRTRTFTTERRRTFTRSRIRTSCWGLHLTEWSSIVRGE